ncbi:hypothetical protein T01_5408, partial [Trichinella spiralis]
MEWGRKGKNDRTISIRIGDGLHNTGGNVVINYITQSGGLTGVWRACRYYGVTNGVEKWTPGIQQSIDDRLGVGGYRWPNPWCKEYRGGSQHW